MTAAPHLLGERIPPSTAADREFEESVKSNVFCAPTGKGFPGTAQIMAGRGLEAGSKLSLGPQCLPTSQPEHPDPECAANTSPSAAPRLLFWENLDPGTLGLGEASHT